MSFIPRPIAPSSYLKAGVVPGGETLLPKVVQQDAGSESSGVEPLAGTNPLMAQSFEQVLARALEPVVQLQQESATMDMKLASGQLEYLHQAMIAGEKASLAFDLTVQVRNKVLEAYQEIMRTQV